MSEIKRGIRISADLGFTVHIQTTSKTNAALEICQLRGYPMFLTGSQV